MRTTFKPTVVERQNVSHAGAMEYLAFAQQIYFCRRIGLRA